MKRRQFVRETLAYASTGSLLGLAPAEGTPRLREMGARKNLLVGSAVSYRELQQPTFTELLAGQASIVVPENEMKWQIIHPEPDRFDFSRADALLSFVQQHGQKL